MRIEKLPSGSYRFQKTINGKRQSFTFDHKPTKKEIEQAIYSATVSTTRAHNLPHNAFSECARQYIQSRENIASPSTLRAYGFILKNLSDEFTSLPINQITQVEVQIEVNEQAQNKSAKTVRNIHGFISAVLKMFNPDLVLRTTLPQREIKEGYIPTSEDIYRLIEAVKGTRYYIPFRLGCYGLRRSEICALCYPDDFNGNYVRIDKAMVLDSEKKWVIKNTKTAASTRTIYIDNELLQEIKKAGKVYDGYPGLLTDTIKIKQDELGLPHFRFHDLRHYFATELSQNGVSEEDIIALGGWSSPYTMKRVYRHSRAKNNKQAQKNISNILVNSISSK